jgi:hypothetical protein
MIFLAMDMEEEGRGEKEVSILLPSPFWPLFLGVSALKKPG